MKINLFLKFFAGPKMGLLHHSREITGHRMVSTLRDFYFKPGREDLRREWVEKMPKLFALSSPSGEPVQTAEGLQEKLDAMTAENWEKVREELRKQIGIGKP